MARIGTMKVNADGFTYQFETYDLNGPDIDDQGIYMFSKATPNSPNGNKDVILYVGETYSFKSRLTPQHEKWKKARDLGMNYIAVHVPQNTYSREIIQDRLIKHFKPPLNERSNPFFKEGN